MFVGHFGVAFAAKKFAPRTNLGIAVLAAEFLDFVWPIFVLAGIEKVEIVPGLTPVTPLDFVSYPWTHSLLMSFAWAVVFGGVYYGIKRDRTGAIVLGAVVLSHWFLDWLVHRPDLPLAPGTARYGLGLWYSRLATVVVELAIFLTGVGLYLRTTRPNDRIGRYALAAYIVVLMGVYAMSIQGGAPPSVPAMALVSLVGTVLFAVWAGWADWHRTPAEAPVLPAVT